MNAVQVLQAAHDTSVRIERAGDALELESERAPPAALVDAITECKSEILALLEKPGAKGPGVSFVQVTRRELATEHHRRRAPHQGLSEKELDAVAGAPEIVGDPELAVAFADAVAARRRRERGERPPGWTSCVICAGCGPVHLWPGSPRTVLGCPRFFNRVEGRPIPQPLVLTCGSCAHFDRMQHLHLGRCACGEPEAPAGLWATDRRACGQWLAQRPD